MPTLSVVEHVARVFNIQQIQATNSYAAGKGTMVAWMQAVAMTE